MTEIERLDRQMQFILEIDKLKDIQRRNYLLNAKKRENSSEHSWHVAVMAMVLAEHSEQKLDLCRVISMLLIHDLVEIDAGDTYCYDQQAALDKSDRENAAAERLFSLLPQDQGRWIKNLWQEFEAGISPEARFANAVDRLMPLLHNYYTQGKSWLEHGISSDEVRARVASIQGWSETLWEYALKVIEKSESYGYLKTKQSKTG